MAGVLRKHVRVSGAEREQLAAEMKRRYVAGESVRALALSKGRSYGFVHALLVEAGAVLRTRGGAVRRKVGAAA